MTWVVALAVLLPGTSSLVSEPTMAVSVSELPLAVPAPIAATTGTASDPPLARAAVAQVITCPFAEQLVPAGGDAETKETPVGRVSVSTTLLAASGPALATVSW